MKFILAIFFVLLFTSLYSQDQEMALKYYELALKKIKDPSFKARGLSSYSEAFPYFFKAASLAKEGSDLQLNAIYQSAYLYNYAKDEEKPIIEKRLIKGLSYVRKKQKRDSLTGEYFFRVGLAYVRDYRPDSAIYIFGEASKIFEGLKGDHSTKISDCLHLIGDVYKDILNDFNSAESFYEKVLDVYEKAENNEINRFLISKLHSELSSVNKYQHDYEKALAYSLKRITFTETLSEKFETRTSILAKSYTNAADIYSEMGFVTEAIKLYQKAIALGVKVKDHRGELGDYYSGLANVYRKAGNIDQSIFYYKKAVKIYDLPSDFKNVLSIKACQHLGESYLELNDFKSSFFYFSKAKHLLSKFKLSKNGQAAQLYTSLGRYFIATNQVDSALIYYQRSLIESDSKFKSLKFKDNPNLEDIILTDFAYEALLAKAIALSELYRKSQNAIFASSALNSFELAEKLLVHSRARLDMDNSKWIFFDSNFGLYQQVLSLLYQMEQRKHSDSLISKAFYYMESSKAKMLADAFNETEFTNRLLASDSIIRFLDFQKRNAYQLQDEFRRKEGNSEEQSRIRDLIIDTDRKIQKAENEIRLKYPSYIKTKYQYDIPALAEIQSLSKKREAAVIEYFWGTDEVFGLAIHHDQIMFKRLGKTDSIHAVLKSVYTMLSSEKYSYTAEEINRFERNANLSYRILVMPFEKIIENEERLLVLPDGPIEQLPFEILVSALTTSSNKTFSSIQYVVNKHILSYSFSSSYLLNQTGSGLKNPHVLAFGFADGMRLRSSDSEKVNGESRLPGSELELSAILKLFPKGEYYFGDEVSEEKFKRKAPDFDIVHLAVHGLGDTEQSYSASLFFHDDVSSTEDGRLHWYELFGLRLKARLAVISSCESGIGKAYRGEGMLSMASAFAFAGGRNIVMGLWKVDDRVSANLMGDFYKNLQAEDPVDVALTKAKRSYLERGDDLTANPKIWASLVSYGNEQIIIKDNANQYWIGFIVLILVACSSILIYIKRKRGHL